MGINLESYYSKFYHARYKRETCNVKSSFCNANFYVVFENKSSLQC